MYIHMQTSTPYKAIPIICIDIKHSDGKLNLKSNCFDDRSSIKRNPYGGDRKRKRM